jgi:proteasome beta subunit
MATIVGVRCRDGIVLAGDRLQVRDGRVESRNRQHVFDFDLDGDAVGGAAVGSDVDRFADRLGGELRSYRLERGPVPLAAVERMGSDVASETGSEAIVAARDRDHDEDENGGGGGGGDGRAALRALYSDGSTLSDSPVVFGSGASLALGQLEAADLDAMSVDDCESFLRETFGAVAERDPGTGEEVDVWTLADDAD